MTDVDAQMLRGSNGDTKYNLAIGEPAIVEYSFVKKIAPANWDISKYPPYQGYGKLVDLLKTIFRAKYAVVTIGCKQALYAAIWALKQDHFSSGNSPAKGFLRHWQPLFWPSYETLADFNNLVLTAGNQRDFHAFNVTTWPNNPDGLHSSPSRAVTYDIWDAAYASPIYGFAGARPKHRISTWSAAKLFGVPGLRIGWALTDDSVLANFMAMYVEKMTSGVTYPSQVAMYHILQGLKEMNPKDLNAEIMELHRKISLNGNTFRAQIGGFASEVLGVPALNGGGMFAFFQVGPRLTREQFERALRRASVKLVDGKTCGAPANENWYRMTMGQTNEYTEEALTALRKELEFVSG